MVLPISTKGVLRAKLNHFLEHFGWNITRITSKSDVQAALELLRPREISQEMFRVGPRGDGGYVLPVKLNDVSILISPGCNGQWDFEKEIYRLFGIPSLLIDHADKMPVDLHPPHCFLDCWVGGSNGIDKLSLTSIIKSNVDDERNFILQMDIEGMEYETFSSINDELLSKAKVVILELHYLELLKNPIWVEYTFKPFMDKLRSKHQIVYIKGNTYCDLIELGNLKWPRVLEVTAVLKDDEYQFGDPVRSYINFGEADQSDMFFQNNALYWFE